MLVQTLALLAIFSAEVDRAGVEAWQPQLHAQVTVESHWRPSVCSAYACGLAQFTDPTWSDIAPYTRPSCADLPPTDPACSIRSQIVYMSRLMRRYDDAQTDVDQWRMAWAAYNGGPGWIRKERRRCKRRVGCDPDVWLGNVADQCMRAEWACDENRAYPLKIEAALP